MGRKDSTRSATPPVSSEGTLGSRDLLREYLGGSIDLITLGEALEDLTVLQDDPTLREALESLDSFARGSLSEESLREYFEQLI